MRPKKGDVLIKAYHNMLEAIAQKILDYAFRPAEDV